MSPSQRDTSLRSARAFVPRSRSRHGSSRRRGRAGGAEDAKLHKLLAQYFEAFQWWDKLRAGRKDAFVLPYLYKYLSEAGAYEMFLTLLRTYQYEPKMRTALERSAQTFAKSKTVLTTKLKRAAPEEQLRVVQEAEAHYRALGELARRAIEVGRPCGEGDVCSAGCFRLVNAGGFGSKDVEHVRDLTDKATELLRSHGFVAVCYGDVQIVRQVSRANVLAHYMPTEDQIYVRGNFPNRAPALHTLLHEIGHRLEAREFSETQRSRVLVLFKRYSQALAGSGFGVLAETPKPGDVLTIKKEHYVVTNVGLNQALNRVIQLALANPQDESEKRFRFSIPLDRWLASQGHKKADDRFVSTYAKTSAHENFAEMFADFCLGRLSDAQKHDFAFVLKG